MRGIKPGFLDRIVLALVVGRANDDGGQAFLAGFRVIHVRCQPDAIPHRHHQVPLYLDFEWAGWGVQ